MDGLVTAVVDEYRLDEFPPIGENGIGRDNLQRGHLLPDSIPIRRVDIVNDNENFNIDAMIKLLKSAEKMPSQIKNLL